MNQETEGNAEPTPEAEPLPCPATSPQDEAAALVTPSTPQVVPPKGVGVQEFKEEKLAEAAAQNEGPKE